jgi:hypothetical protein
MVERLKERAERDITPLRVQDRRLSITGVGYLYPNGSPRLVFFRLSNFESAEANPQVADSADSKFHLWTWIAKENESSARLRHVSGWNSIPSTATEPWSEVWELLGMEKPPKAIVSRITKVIRLTADDRKTKGMVGRQCMSIIIPSDPSVVPIGEYHADAVKATAYVPGRIEARGGQFGVFAMTDAQFGTADGKSPFVVPQVSRNRPCPCGSGKKYKYCHGRTFKVR